MAELVIQYTSGECSGPLQSHLRATGALTAAIERLKKELSSNTFLQELPYAWLFVHVRYGCADFHGKSTTVTSTVPTKEWKADKKRGEFLAFISIDGSKWEAHDKVLRKRTHLAAAEIARQVQLAVICALIWVARIHGLSERALFGLKSELGNLAGAMTPEDLPTADVSKILGTKDTGKTQGLPPLSEPLYRKEKNQLEYLELTPEKQRLVVKRAKVGEVATHEVKKPPRGGSIKETAKAEQLAAANAGYAPLSGDQWTDLEVTVPIRGFGTEEDNKRKNRMAEVLRKELPLRGLGSWTGDSIGSGTFEIGVRVADESIARRVIPELLQIHGLGEGVAIEEL